MKRIHRCALAIALAIMVAALPAWAQQYHEAPMLAEMVAAGDLPPVEERLPANPFVRQVHSEIGTYGGTLNKWDTNL
ncbi:MAG: ABC transporter substrate-binding protein, partial [Chloroflexota bacterium]|nr:ABC transporter substrate-binding protein [Chloroflexota bacterium]